MLLSRIYLKGACRFLTWIVSFCFLCYWLAYLAALHRPKFGESLLKYCIKVLDKGCIFLMSWFQFDRIISYSLFCLLVYFSLIIQLLIKLEDNRLIETVGIPVEDEKGPMRLTACVSSQVNFLKWWFASFSFHYLF